MSGFSEGLPESNVEQVTSDLLLKTVALDGSGLVHVFAVLSARAEEHRRILVHCDEASRAMLEGREPVMKEAVAAQVMDSMFETTCLTLFLARACRKLAEHLEEGFQERQHRFRRITKVEFATEGKVECYELEE
jgi:hypothetical protein